MDKCGICLKPAEQLFETGNEGVYACFKCQPLVPEITIEDNGDSGHIQDQPQMMVEVEVQLDRTEEGGGDDGDGEGSLFCGICQKTFQKNAQLQAHIRNHRAERRFVCTYCNKAFSQSNNLRAHLRIHTNERPYKCGECGKAFTQVTNLNNHVRLHTGERPFVCTEPGCNKAYAQVTNLNQHRKRHESGRGAADSYDCPICGERFQQRNHMYTHRRDAHSDLRTGPVRFAPRILPRRHVCKLCDLGFPNERLLQNHVEQHVTHNAADKDGDSKQDGDDKSAMVCVFRSCGARFSSAHEHTEHLLSAHQLRVLAARPQPPARRGRPRKPSKLDQEQDPLAMDVTEEPEFRPKRTKITSRSSALTQIKIANANSIQFVSKLKLQGMFQ